MKTLFPVFLLASVMLPFYGIAQQMWTLKDCMMYSIENHPDIKIRDINNENTQMTLRNSKLARIPTLSASTSVSASYGRTIDSETNAYTTQSSMSNSYSASLGSISIFNGFSIANDIKYNKISLLQGTETKQQLIDQMARSIISAYFNVIYSIEMVRIAEGQLESERRNLNSARVSAELGLKGSSDLLQIEASVAESESRLMSNINMLNNRILTLKDLMYYPLEEELLLDTSQQWENISPIIQDEPASEIFEKAVNYLPSVLISKMNVDQAKLNLKTAKWQLLPSISLGLPSVSTGYSRSLSESNSGRQSFTEQFRNRVGGSIGSLSMSIPIFNRLSRQTTVARGKNSLKIYEYQYDMRLRSLEKEIQAAIQDLEGAKREYELAVKQLSVREAAHNANQRRYDEGLLSIMDLQNSSNSLLSAQASKLNAQFTYLLKQRDMEYYTGTPYLEQEF